MCGIAGFFQKRKISKNELISITDSLEHRGPDDAGYYFREKEFYLGLGQRRLSIIDLSSAGHQPMCDETQNFWITFNGEIYNYQEIKNDLLNKGYKFKSATDTEVIIYGYIEYGDNIVSKLNGMFAFAIFDSKKNELLLARDRFGQKPLYYWLENNNFCFASELKAILKHPFVSKDLNFEALSSYLAYEYYPAPLTPIKNVFKLEQASILKVSIFNGKLKIRKDKYWEVDLSKQSENRQISFGEAKKQLIDKLRKSIEIRMMSDVPLGVFLSGGIDSSSIVALMAEITDIRKVKTFSIGFQEKSFDESDYADKIANLYETDHFKKILTLDKTIQILPEVLDKLDEPYADASLIPTYLLTKFTKEHVTVALGGDGGDELFTGYDPFLAHQYAKFYEIIPKSIHNRMIKPLIQMLPVSTKNMSLDFKLKHFMKGIHFEPSIRNQIWLGAFDHRIQKELLLDFKHDPYKQIKEISSKQNFRDDLSEISFMYQKMYLADDILVKIDRASMMNSLEARTPFLDYQFAEFANSLPSKFKLKGTIRKYILKKSLEDKLPKDILYRQKKGFGIPLAKWINEDLKSEFKAKLDKSIIAKQGIFNENYVENLLKEHFSMKKDNRKELWTLFIFQDWLERYGIL